MLVKGAPGVFSHTALYIVMILVVCVHHIWNAQVKCQVSEKQGLRTKKYQQPVV